MVAMRLEEETIAELDELAAALSKRAAGAEVSRSEAARLALGRGIPALRAELSEKKPPKKR